MRYYISDVEVKVSRGNKISETVGRIDALNDQLDALLTQQHRIQSQLLEISVGLDEVKRLHGL